MQSAPLVWVVVLVTIAVCFVPPILPALRRRATRLGTGGYLHGQTGTGLIRLGLFAGSGLGLACLLQRMGLRRGTEG